MKQKKPKNIFDFYLVIKTKPDEEIECVSLWSFNPSFVFKEILGTESDDKPRSLIIISGTLAPLDTF